jgi:hypothetical protein
MCTTSRVQMWCMPDCASAHFSCAVRDVLNNTCHDWRIGRWGPIAWPPCPSDLNLQDFYLWAHLELLVHKEALYHCIVDTCGTFCVYSSLFEQVLQSMMRHVMSRRTFWAFITDNSFSSKSQIKCFQTHVDMDILSCFGIWNLCPNFFPAFQLHSVSFSIVSNWQRTPRGNSLASCVEEPS